MIPNRKIILGSQSPRRKELLAGLDIDFTIRVADIVEDFPEDLPIPQIAEYIARKKMHALRDSMREEELIICSDTIVVIHNEILGKPVDRKEATAMLQKLSGNTHKVITGVAMADQFKEISFSDQTLVTFKKLTLEEIDYYLDHYQPYDKAGSYGVQEWIGMMGIVKMDGSYFTVMGLPVHLIYDYLSKWS
ncbi:MAG: Maf family protein [Crocinitomicaceae bacterium]